MLSSIHRCQGRTKSSTNSSSSYKLCSQSQEYISTSKDFSTKESFRQERIQLSPISFALQSIFHSRKQSSYRNHSPPVQDTTPNMNTPEVGENSSLHDQRPSPPPNSIASKAFGVFQPAAQSLKIAFRAVSSLLPYTHYQSDSRNIFKPRTYG